MKAINKIIILGMAVALFNSCDLTLLPENAVTPENYFQNKSDLELWTNQFYTLLDEPDASAGTNADDMIDKGMGQVIEGTRSAASETGWSWTKLRHINYFLQHSSNCDDETARNQYNGVAQFFRAYFYFVKVRRYGDVPWYDQVLGSEDQELLVKARDSREFVMNQVLKDFQDAATSLPTKSTETRNTRVTKWAALAFASQAALYKGLIGNTMDWIIMRNTWKLQQALPGSLLTKAASACIKKERNLTEICSVPTTPKPQKSYWQELITSKVCNYHTPYNSASLTCKWDLPAGL